MNKKLLACFLVLGNILGLNPKVEPKKSQKNGTKYRYLKFYIPLLIILMVEEYVRFLYWFFQYAEGWNKRFVHYLVGTLPMGILTIDIILIIFFMNYTKNKKWRTMKKYLNIVENKLDLHHKSTDTGVLGNVYIDLFFITTTYFSIEVLSVCVFFKYKVIKPFYAYESKIYYWYMMVLIYQTVTKIRNSFKKLHEFLEDLLPTNVEDDHKHMKSVQPYNFYSEFMKFYRIIYDVVQIFNEIFGYHMVFLNLYCILEWLTALNSIIYSIKYDISAIDIIAVVFLQAVTTLVGNIFIILLCSAVTSEAEHFLSVLHQIEDDNHNLKAKSIVIQLVEDMPIHFSAARFFNISKYTILGIIGNCTTYFIVLIQFYQ